VAPKNELAEDCAADRMGGFSDMLHPDETAPKGWRELRAQLQTEKDPERFREILEQINRLLFAYEKSDRQESCR
jgi:hypothetical protein